MKKIWIVMVLMLILSGCGAAETFETLGDACADQPAISPQVLTFTVPEDAAAQVMRSENGTLYFCDGYEITVQTLEAGDISRTLQTLTGYSRDALTVIETSAGGVKRFESAWTAAGEGGDQVGRAVILDDGYYHYCLSVMASALEAGSLQETWQALLATAAIQS